MRILIDGLIIDKDKAGIGQYGYNLVKEFAGREEFDYTLLLQESVSINSNKVLYKKEFNKSFQRIAFEQFALPFYSRNYDLVHFIDYSSPVVNLNRPFILTIHDLSFFKYPETFSKGSRMLKQFLTPLGVKRASRIIADSENTKSDLLEYFPEAKDKVKVIYPAVTGFARVLSQSEVDRIKEKYNIAGRYILAVGTIEPRKNLIRILKAFKLISREFPDIKLVLVGKKGWLYEEIVGEAADEALKDKVICTGYVDQEDMNHIYSGAECFVYPSLYEGFGLPPLEAMSCSVPVVASNTSSLPEVVGKGGLLVNPIKVDEIADAVKRILSDKALKADLIREGVLQAQKFIWSNSIEEIVSIYREILE